MRVAGQDEPAPRRRLGKPRQRRPVASSSVPPARDGLVVLHPTAEQREAERKQLARDEQWRKAQDQLAAEKERALAELVRNAGSPRKRALLRQAIHERTRLPRRRGRPRGSTLAELKVARVEVRYQKRLAALLAGHGFQEYVPRVERKYTALRLECRQVPRELDATRRISVRPDFVNELELRLRRHLVRSHARRGPPNTDGDTDPDDLASVVGKIVRWLTGQKQGAHRGQR